MCYSACAAPIPTVLPRCPPYLITLFSPPPGEYALRHLLAPGAWAHEPLAERLRELKVPVTFIYGEADWMRPEHAVQLCRDLKGERQPQVSGGDVSCLGLGLGVAPLTVLRLGWAALFAVGGACDVTSGVGSKGGCICSAAPATSRCLFVTRIPIPFQQ